MKKIIGYTIFVVIGLLVLTMIFAVCIKEFGWHGLLIIGAVMVMMGLLFLANNLINNNP